jgi:hypothetical protein
MKLKKILRENKKEQMMRQLTREDKSAIMDSVSKFNSFGSKVYKANEIKEMVHAIKEMASGASKLALQETDDWFDGVTVKRDMKEVANSVKLFEKTAQEMTLMQQRLESVYEDMGNKLGKYYDIHEAEKGDMDGDGLDEPDEDEYMDSKDDAIKKSMQNENLEEATSEFDTNYNQYHKAMGNMYKVVSKQDKGLAREFTKSWQRIEDTLDKYIGEGIVPEAAPQMRGSRGDELDGVHKMIRGIVNNTDKNSSAYKTVTKAAAKVILAVDKLQMAVRTGR